MVLSLTKIKTKKMKNKTKIKISKSLKKHHELKKQKHDIAIILTVLVIIVVFFGGNTALENRASATNDINTQTADQNATTVQTEARKPLYSDTVEMSRTEFIKDYIRKEAVKNNINPETALAVAKCESSFNPEAKNPNSTAKGLFQFINGTWRGYCKGDVMNYKDNTDCFMQLFKKYPTWWQCWEILGRPSIN
jgi:hypothetical protein